MGCWSSLRRRYLGCWSNLRRRRSQRQVHKRLGSRLGIRVRHWLHGVASHLWHQGLLDRGRLGSGWVDLRGAIGLISVLLHTWDQALKVGAALLGDWANRRGSTQGRRMAAHERHQLALVLIEYKQLFGQRGLVAEHVDQETQRTQVVAQLLEGTSCAGLYLVDLGIQNFIDHRAHADHRVHRLVQAEHRQHAPHLRQLRHGHMQTTFFNRRAEELVQRFFRLTQRHLEFTHHAAHGLAIAHAPVEVLHPSIERLSGLARDHRFQALGERLGALRHRFVVGVEVLECGFQIQGGGGHLHRQLGPNARATAGGLIGGFDQRQRQHGAQGMQLEQGVGNQPDLVLHLVRPGGVTT